MDQKIHLYEQLIRDAIAEAIPDCEQRGVSSIIQSLLTGHAQAWISHEGNDINALAITKISNNDIIASKVITIMALYAPNKLEESAYAEAIETIRLFAEKSNCYKLDFYTDNPVIESYAKKFNVQAKTKYYQISF